MRTDGEKKFRFIEKKNDTLLSIRMNSFRIAKSLEKCSNVIKRFFSP